MNRDGSATGEPPIDSEVARWILRIVLTVLLVAGAIVWTYGFLSGECFLNCMQLLAV